MAIFKCKMCGGALTIEPGQTVCECEYCGSMQTLPNMEDDRKANLYDRANHFRRNNEFDKAASVYEKLLAEDGADAEAYWSLVLCRYGIEYVEDPSTHKRVPTVNRAQYTSIFDDDNYRQAIAHADVSQKLVYEKEAKAINEIQKGILAISQKEEPFDVFICYKETDANGRRTPDSVLANDLYHQLKQEGFKVFFSRITLEDKLGVAYEPYIFAALNSAKVMVVLGTRSEYFNAVWVKNEWSRYLAIVKQSGGKKMLIPAYRDMDPYDLPDEFSHLQAQDMAKLGFMQDLIRGIKKILEAEKPKPQPVQSAAPRATVSGGNVNVENLYRRAQLFLEDGDFRSADEYADKILDVDAEFAPAYMLKVLAAYKAHNEAELGDKRADDKLRNNPNLQKAIRFGAEGSSYARTAKSVSDNAEFVKISSALSIKLDPTTGVTEYTNAAYRFLQGRIESEGTDHAQGNQYREAAARFKKLGEYPRAAECAAMCEKLTEIMAKYNKYSQLTDSLNALKNGCDDQALKKVAQGFESLGKFRDSAKRRDDANAAEQMALQTLYNRAVKMIEGAADYERAEAGVRELRKLSGKMSIAEGEKLYEQTKEKIAAHERAKEEEARAYLAHLQAQRVAKKRNKIILSVVCVVMAAALCVWLFVITPMQDYNAAKALYEGGKYEEAIAAFEAMNGYSDSVAQIEVCQEAIKEREYNAAKALYDGGEYAKALAAFSELKGYKDVDNLLGTDDNLLAAAKEPFTKAGSIVQYGHYEQDNNGASKEPIEWRVLEYDSVNDRTLLISLYGLDAKAYHHDTPYPTWEKSDIRAWLNGDFLKEAFTADEQKGIETVKLQTPSYKGNSGGNDTQDRIWLLSREEAEAYFSGDDDRMAKLTAYAVANGAREYSNGCCAWWLRSPGDYSYSASIVYYYGSIYDDYYVYRTGVCVRPAFWLNLKNL